VGRGVERLRDVTGHPTSRLLHGEADELERVVGPLLERRKLLARDGERGAALNAAIEPDHGALVRTALRRDDLCGLAVDVERRARCDRVRTLARAFDGKGPVEPGGDP